MNLNPAPRLPKWPFLVADAVLLGAAFLIVSYAKDPFAPAPLISAVVCVVLGAVAILVPFLTDYARTQDEAARELHDAMEGQIKRLHAASESLTRAAAHAKAVEEAAHKTMHAAENLPYRMQEKLAEFNQQLEQAEDEEKQNMATELAALRQSEGDKLQAVADKVQKATAEMTALEKTTRTQLSAAELKLQQVASALTDASRQYEQRVSELHQKLAAQTEAFEGVVVAAKAAVAAIPAASASARTQDQPAPARPSRTPKSAAVEEPVSPPPAPAIPATVAPLAPSVEPVGRAAPSAPTETTPASSSTEPSPTAAPAVFSKTEKPAPANPPAPASEPSGLPPPPAAPAEPKPRKPRAPRKPKTEEPAPATGPAGDVEAPAPAAEAKAAPAATPEPVRSSDEDTLPLASTVESSASSDGATRLLATAYIGIGNKLFLRGEGPGLSWDRGVPMQFISIGKWGWHTHEATAPVRCKLYKNDETAALGGEIALDPGRHVEISAMF